MSYDEICLSYTQSLRKQSCLPSTFSSFSSSSSLLSSPHLLPSPLPMLLFPCNFYFFFSYSSFLYSCPSILPYSCPFPFNILILSTLSSFFSLGIYPFSSHTISFFSFSPSLSLSSPFSSNLPFVSSTLSHSSFPHTSLLILSPLPILIFLLFFLLFPSSF